MTVPLIAGGACAATEAGLWAALRLCDGSRHPGPAFPLEISHEEYATCPHGWPGTSCGQAHPYMTDPSHVPGREATPGTTALSPATWATRTRRTFPAGDLRRRALTWWRHTRYRLRRIDGWAELQAATARHPMRPAAVTPEWVAVCWVTAFSAAVLAAWDTRPRPLYNDAEWRDYLKAGA